MSKFSSLTENRYTLNDIFAKNYQIWMMIPLFIYLLTPVVHMIVYASLYDGSITGEKNIAHYMATLELPGDYYSPICQCAFAFGAVFAVIAYISYLVAKKQQGLKRFPDSIPTWFFIAYLILIVVSTIANKTGFNYIMGYTARAEGVTSFFAYYLVFYLCGSFVTKDKYKYSAIYFFLITSVVIGLLTIIDEYITDISIIGEYRLPCGIFYTHNFYAYYLSIAIMLSAALIILNENKAVKVLSALAFVMNTFILAINDSLGGFLACMVAFVFLVFAVSVKNKKISISTIAVFAVFMIVIFITGLFVPSFFSEITGLVKDVETIVEDSENAGSAGTARWTLWVHTAQYIKEKPWIGWGFEGTAARLGTETHTDKAHNEYLENMAYFGIPAGIIYIAALLSVYIKAWKRRRHVSNATICCLAGALGYIGSALVGNSFIFTAPFCFIFLGLANSTVDKSVETQSPVKEEIPEEINASAENEEAEQETMDFETVESDEDGEESYPETVDEIPVAE